MRRDEGKGGGTKGKEEVENYDGEFVESEIRKGGWVGGKGGCDRRGR